MADEKTSRRDWLKKMGNGFKVAIPAYFALKAGLGVKAATLSSGSVDDLVYSPPIPDATIPVDMQNYANKPWGWGHKYDVTMDDPKTMPEVLVTGGSSNVDYDTIIEPTGDPLEYKVHLIFKTGSDVSTENLTINFQAVPVGIPEESEQTPYSDFVLRDSYPNPFLDKTTIEYKLRSPADVSINVYDLNGSLVKQLQKGKQSGEQVVQWNGDNDYGAEVSNGIYLIRVATPGTQKTLKVMKQ